MAVIFAVYGGVAAMAVLTRDSWVLWLLSLPVIGGLQNHLLLLHHEGGHGLLHPRRAVNDFITNVFCGYPFFELLQPYRAFHFAHHRHVTDGARDPELEYYRQQGFSYGVPRTRRERLSTIALDLTGYHWFQFFFAFLRDLRPGQKLITRQDRASVAVFLFFLGGLLYAGLGPEIFFYWLAPQFSFTFFFAKERGYREHGPRNGGTISECTFNVRARIWERFFLFPLNCHLHRNHHENPTLEWFRLPQFHETQT